MPPENHAPVPRDARPLFRHGVIDMRVLTHTVRSEALTFCAVIAVFLIAAVLYLDLSPKRYAVRVMITSVAPREQSGGGALSELGSLAGFDVGGSGNSQFRLFVGALRSPFAAQAVAADQDLLKAMYPREWSATGQKWHPPPSLLGGVVRRALGFLGWATPPWTPPNATRVFDYLRNELKIVPDARSGAVTLEIDSHDPEVAQRVLLTMNHALNERMRQRDLEQATVDIGYLQQRLSAVTVEDYRRALVTNLVDQEKTRMLASAPLPYIADTLGKPMTSTKPVSPVPPAVLTAALIFGALIGVGIARFRYKRRWR